jgi:hypothetical protein
VTQLTQNEWVTTFNLFGRSAVPRVPVVLGGKRLGGHCMRVAGCNHAAALNATIVQIANKGRWGAWAFAAAKGYDYLRTDRPGIQALTMNMVVALASLPYAQAQPTHSVVLNWDTAMTVAWALVIIGAGGMLGLMAAGGMVRECWRWGTGTPVSQAQRGKRVSFSPAPPGGCAGWSRKTTRGVVGVPGTSSGITRNGGYFSKNTAGSAGMGPVVAKSEPEAPLRASRAGGQATHGRLADMGPAMIPSAPEASIRDWREWGQAERARGLADFHVRMMDMRERRQREPKKQQPRTLG